MLKTDTNCGGLSIEVFDGIRVSVFMDRSQFFKDLTVPFCSAHRPLRVRKACGAQSGSRACNLVSRTSSIAQGFSETDFSADMKKIDMPTLICMAAMTRSWRSARRLMIRQSSSASGPEGRPRVRPWHGRNARDELKRGSAGVVYDLSSRLRPCENYKRAPAFTM
jgi:hypothetical protein